MQDETQTAQAAPATRARARRKAEVIAAAAECFMERGYQATAVDDVAERLGCTKGRIYHYYASKTDLFFDVHRAGMERLFDALMPATKAHGTGLEVLRAMCLAHAEALLAHHTFVNVVAQGVHMHRFDSTPENREIVQSLIDSRDRFEGYFKATLTRAINDGSIRPVDVPITAKVLLGGLQWSLFWYRPNRGDSRSARVRLAEKMVDPLIDGLRVP